MLILHFLSIRSVHFIVALSLVVLYSSRGAEELLPVGTYNDCFGSPPPIHLVFVRGILAKK